MTKPKYGPYEFMIRYDSTERKLIFVVNGQKHVWDIAELDNPREQPVARSAKKSAVAERTLAERKYCEIDQFYYSEMFTCPICYGGDRERDRIISMLNGYLELTQLPGDHGVEINTEWDAGFNAAIALIKGEEK